MPIRLADVVRVNTLAVPPRAPVNYQVLQHELRLVLIAIFPTKSADR
jgi:hypothetical protein